MNLLGGNIKPEEVGIIQQKGLNRKVRFELIAVPVRLMAMFSTFLIQ